MNIGVFIGVFMEKCVYILDDHNWKYIADREDVDSRVMWCELCGTVALLSKSGMFNMCSPKISPHSNLYDLDINWRTIPIGDLDMNCKKEKDAEELFKKIQETEELKSQSQQDESFNSIDLMEI